jgi:hypothetical protein
MYRVALLALFTGALGANAIASEASNAPARALPLQVVICVDRGKPRCWTAASEAECRSADGGEVFRVLDRGDGSVAHGSALTECWRSVGKGEADQ